MADTCISSTWTTGTFQLPLSGSRNMLKEEYKLLSTIKLSTPSLGITFAARFAELAIRIWNFQLPLSGSLDIQAVDRENYEWTFQLPLSGSLVAEKSWSGKYSFLSTPSLGITRRRTRAHLQQQLSSFNSLSRDHLLRSWA